MNVLTVIFAAVAWTAGAASERPILAINEDNDHYFKLSREMMTKEALVAYVDRILAPGYVTDLVLCPCGQRTSYASKVWEPIWCGTNEPDHDGRTNNIWCVNAKLLDDRGIDPYVIWLGRCRAKGVRGWLSMRMNDVHFVNITNYFRSTTFQRTRRDLWRNPAAVPGKSPWEDMALNYAKAEVQEYSFSLFRELVDRYDADGYELDWMRFTRHLTPEHEREEAPLLTAFMRRCRAYTNAAAKRRGHPILVSVRVDSKLETALARGTDAPAWAREGLVDWVIVTPFFEKNDFEIDMKGWCRALDAGKSAVKLLPGATENLDNTVHMTIPDFSCWARRMRLRGAEGIYLFNVPYLTDDVIDFIYGGGLSRFWQSRSGR
ncbi:MAG: hypothetical protein MJ240_14640, partial [Kiritimatiellae bacterium]|nr:hypothetical protein [Kiritimatiellia bacterium]